MKLALVMGILSILSGCSSGGTSSDGAGGSSSSGAGGITGKGGSTATGGGTPTGGSSAGGTTATGGGTGNGSWSAGNPDGSCSAGVPAEGQPADTSSPTTVVGAGTENSCTFAALNAAVATGGVITFDCGSSAVTIPVTATLNVPTDKDTVIDGNRSITLDGQSQVRILSFDSPNWQNNEHRLTLQHIALTNGKATPTESYSVRAGDVLAGMERRTRRRRLHARRQPHRHRFPHRMLCRLSNTHRRLLGLASKLRPLACPARSRMWAAILVDSRARRSPCLWRGLKPVAA
ncbi:MAG TPA: hypothetical protein VGJ84_09125 [Polyangiaceae bacterium]